MENSLEKEIEFAENLISTPKTEDDTVEVEAEYSGPIPTPEMMRTYYEIDPSLPDRIMSMAEKANDAAIRYNLAKAELVEVESEAVRAEIDIAKKGQILVFCLLIIMIGAVCLLGYTGHENVAITLVGALTVAGIVMKWRSSRKNKEKE